MVELLYILCAHQRHNLLLAAEFHNFVELLRGIYEVSAPPHTPNSHFTPHLKEEEGYMFWHRDHASKYLEDTDLALFRL